MPLDCFTIIPNYQTNSTSLILAEKEDILNCENILHCNFEEDYKEYVTTYGSGILGGTYIRIYLPHIIQSNQQQWLDRINEYYFWEEGKDILTKEEVLNSICIGDTFDGDELIYYKNKYYILPRYEEMIYSIGNNLNEAIKWLCSSNILTEAFTERNFEPFNSKNS
ncbi:SMI1/KNR4 family protein [Myroides injenensis]|uniref:SMI1/KNR4 family protein n=1 Tax=Myroides injenensis TaxID=1183151 RepID=UPI0002899799|nr:SMI1/KNR4 family protein [Myroides injenensis]